MYCNNCGNKMNENEKFCSKCGNKREVIINSETNKMEEYKQTSLVLGIVCIISSFIVNILCYIPGIISIVYAKKYKKQSGKYGTGFGLSIAGMVISILIIIISLVFLYLLIFNVSEAFIKSVRNEPITDNYYEEKYNDNEEVLTYTVGTSFEYKDLSWTVMYNDDNSITAISNDFQPTSKDYFLITNEDIDNELKEFKNNLNDYSLNARLINIDDINNLCSTIYDSVLDTYKLTNCPTWLIGEKETLTSIPTQNKELTITADSTIQNFYYLSNIYNENIELSSVIKLNTNLFTFRPIITITK